MADTRALFIGQAPPRGVVDVPFGRTALYAWLEKVAIPQDYALANFAFTALIAFFPGMKGGSHRPPSPAEIMADRPRLVGLIKEMNPPLIVPVGILSAREVLAQPTLLLTDVIGQRFKACPFGVAELGERTIIPLPHPSGASAWVHQGNHRTLLDRALELIAQEIKEAR